MPKEPRIKEHKSTLEDDLKTFKIEDENLSPLIKEEAFASANFPHEKSLNLKKYEKRLKALQIELLKAQKHLKDKGLRVVVIFEGRDAAGKGGAIARVTEHLNPRSARVVALSKPTDTEKGQFYFQRYLKEMPTTGEMVLFDRSYYNRAVVEPVMGFCSAEQSDSFLKSVPDVEKMLTSDGVILIKIWLHVGHAMQLKRLYERYHDPLKQWKLSPVDFASIGKWNDYSLAIEKMLEKTSTKHAPWVVFHANDKRRARLAVIEEILNAIPYEGKDEKAYAKKPYKIRLSAEEFLKQGGEE